MRANTKNKTPKHCLSINGYSGYTLTDVANIIGVGLSTLSEKLQRTNYIYEEVINGFQIKCSILPSVEDFKIRKYKK